MLLLIRFRQRGSFKTYNLNTSNVTVNPDIIDTTLKKIEFKYI